MKIPDDLQAGNIFHTNDKQELEFTGYVMDSTGVAWADTKMYSFLVETGIADPTEIEVIRIQRVNSSGVSDEMKRESDAMIKQERTTKTMCAMELSFILANHTDKTLREAITIYKERLLRHDTTSR